MSWCGFDDVAQEFLALLSTLHDFTGGLNLFRMLWSVWRVVIFLILVTHGLFSLCGGVAEPLSNVELPGKLKYNLSVRLTGIISRKGSKVVGQTVMLTFGYKKAECVACVALNPTLISKPRSMGQQEDTCKNTHHQWRICISTIFQIIQ